MRILTVTDIHGNRRRTRLLFNKLHGEVDIVVVNGDITQFQGLDVAEEILSILSRIGRESYFIPGNCDPVKLLRVDRLGGAVNIHGKKVEIGNNLELIGLGGSTITPFNTWIEFKDDEYMNILPEPSSQFILASHDPPYNTKIDRTWRGEHVGSRSVREFILEYKPILGLHGHIHEARGRDRLGETIVINPGPLYGGYYSIIEVSSREVTKIDFNKI